MFDLNLMEFEVNYAWTKSFEPAPSESHRLGETSGEVTQRLSGFSSHIKAISVKRYLLDIFGQKKEPKELKPLSLLLIERAYSAQ